MTRSLARSLGAIILGISVLIATGASAIAVGGGTGFNATTYATLPSGTSAGIAFVGSVMYTLDSTGGGLYRTAIAGTTTLVTTIAGNPTGLAATGGFLYATRRGPNDIIKIDLSTIPATVTTVALSAVFADLPLTGIAADAGNGDLFVATTAGYIYAFHTLPTLSGPILDTQLVPGHPSAYGIAVAADHSLYVAVTTQAANGVWQIQGPIGARTVGPMGVSFAGARGVGVIPGFVFSNNVDGSITKLVIPSGSRADALFASVPAIPGDLGTIGFDQCFYASQGATVVRLANADGSCNLAGAAPPPLPPTLTLTRVSNTVAHAGIDQSFSAQLGNVAMPAGITITFTVTRGLASTPYTNVTGVTGEVGFSYHATSAGTDVITATATVGGNVISSNPVTVVWLAAIDLIPPKISYVVTGTPGTNFGCPVVGLGKPGETEFCGWYVSPPTIAWTVVPGVGSTSGVDWTLTHCDPFTLTVDSPITGTPRTCIAYNGDGKSSALKVVLQALITAPTITASASTPAGPYVAGTPTNQTVTVTFACASDPDLGPTAVRQCTAPVTVTAEGTATVSGTVQDIAGTQRTASFGPIIVDRTAPVVTATYRTATDGLLYVPGTLTTQNVTVTFACTDNLDPRPSCPAPVTVNAGPSVTVSASDWAGNTRSYTFGGININGTGADATQFAIWGGNAGGIQIGQRVIFWGEHWWDQVNLSEKSQVKDFKGFADTVKAASWTAKPGNSKPPQSIGSYISVIVTTNITRSGGQITGNIVGHAILRVDSTYKDEPSKAVYGVVVGILP